MRKKFLKLLPIFQNAFASDAIDLDNGIIKGVSVATEGEVKGHGIYADSTFIEQITALGAAQTEGVKARFGHPNMCATALGTYVGRFKNYRVEGDKSVADLHLDDSAKVSPNGNLYEYVLAMATENPDMFGTSVVFKMGESEMKEETVDGETVEREYARADALLATDLVDDPAANEGLFSAFSHEDIAMQVTDFLDAHPEIWEVVDANPEVYEEFLGRYTAYKERTSSTSTEATELTGKLAELKAWVTEKLSSISSTAGATEVKVLDNAELMAKLEAFTNIVAEATTKLNAKQSKIVELEAEIVTLKAKGITDANEIARLSGTGAASDNGGNEGTDDGSSGEVNDLWSFMANKVNKRRS